MIGDGRLIRKLRELDRPVEPSPEFRVFLLAELGSDGDGSSSTDSRPEHRREKSAHGATTVEAPKRISGLGAAALAFGTVIAVGLLAWMLRPSAPSDAVAPSSTTGTPTTMEVAPELRIPNSTELRPVDPLLSVSPDWVRLDPGPLSPRWPAVVAWTGQEMVLWGGEPIGGGIGLEGGAAFRPDTDTWRELSDSPLPAASEVSWVWTGDEVVIWTDTKEAAAWNPLTNSWRSIEAWPLSGSFYTLAVWTGESILDVSRGLLVDPHSGATQNIAEPPELNNRASVVWAGDAAVIVTAEGVYNLSLDDWVHMPPSELTPLATAGAWTGSAVIAADYLMNASAYEPSNGTWTAYPKLPLRFSECAPTVHVVAGVPVVSHCSGVAVWNQALATWLPVGVPHATSRVDTFLSADGQVYAWGEGFYRLDAEQMDNPRRLAVGIGFLDLPEGWTVSNVSSETASGPDRETFVTLILQRAGATCTIRATHADARAVLARSSANGPTIGELTPNAGGAPWQTLEFFPNSTSGQHRIVWAAGTTDVFDVSCSTRSALDEIAPTFWTPYQ